MWQKLKQLLCWHNYTEQQQLVRRTVGSFFTVCSDSRCSHLHCWKQKWLECTRCKHCKDYSTDL